MLLNKLKYFLLVLILCLAVKGQAFAVETEKVEVLEEKQYQTLPDLIESILPTVVNISATRNNQYTDIKDGYYEKNFKDSAPKSVGSGFIYNDEGYVVTNNHVIEDTDEIFVTLKGSKTKFTANVVGVDKKTDLAVLKINIKVDLPHAVFDTTNSYRIGDQVIVAGNPFNLGISVSKGIISAVNRDIKISAFDNFIQTDAAINKGNSGGPMFDLEGNVIGITSAIYSPDGGNVGIGFAIPASDALPVIEKIIRYGFVRRGWLGITANEADSKMFKALGVNQKYGILVTDVVDGSPAQKAHILPSDVIIAFNDNKIKQLKDLPLMVAATEIGRKVELTVVRKGKSLNISTVIEESKEKGGRDDEYEGIQGNSIEIFDMYLSSVDGVVRKRFKLDHDIEGFLVLRVKKNGLAATKGIRSGDIILSANQMPLVSKIVLRNVITRAKNTEKANVLLIIKRYNKNTFVLMPLGDLASTSFRNL